ncbi:hypothetical protein ACFFS2_24720 [Streptomyces aurantiacus]
MAIGLIVPHGDDRGLRAPPRLAPSRSPSNSVQVVVLAVRADDVVRAKIREPGDPSEAVQGHRLPTAREETMRCSGPGDRADRARGDRAVSVSSSVSGNQVSGGRKRVGDRGRRRTR